MSNDKTRQFRLDAEQICEYLNYFSPIQNDYRPSDLTEEVVAVFSKDYEEGGAEFAVYELLGLN